LDRFDFDLVISDIVMPGKMNGIELARTIRERHRSVPIFLVTGYAGSADKGAAEFFVLRKPFGLQELQRTIQQASERAGARTTKLNPIDLGAAT
jgi:CheY-like chemotaxis protein